MKIKKENLVTPKESTTIKELHEEWAVKNGYQENDILNSKNSIVFKDGAER
tara:strand:+ start:471 stop:623 length:153 start_codon:yes stop_codon:yes gene_type:complete